MDNKKLKKETRKITLSDSGVVYELKKHSSIIQMSNATTLLQRKSFNALLWIANQSYKEGDKRIFETSISNLKSLISDQAINNKHLKQILKQMQSTNVEYNILWKDKKEVWGSFNLLSRVQTEYSDSADAWKVKFEFPSIILESLNNPRLYAKLDLFLMKNLESKHTIALYELLKDYQNLGKFNICIEDFKKIMAIQDTQYSSITMLKKKVLDVAVSEINDKTDLMIDYTIVKEWRSISWINFVIWIRQKTKQLGIQKVTFQNTDDDQKELIKSLMSFWIPELKATEIVSKYDREYILWNIAVVESKLKAWKIKNQTAYMLQAITENFIPKPTEYDKMQKQKQDNKAITDQQKKDEENKKKEEAEQYEKERKEFIVIRDSKIDELVASKAQGEVEKLKSSFMSKNANNPFMKNIENGDMSHRLVKPMRYNYLASELLPEHEWNFELYKKYWGWLFN